MILVAEPPLQALIMISSSMIVSLILGLPDCTMKTSFSRTLLEILTLVSPYCRTHCARLISPGGHMRIPDA